MSKAEDMGNFYRIPMDNRDMNYNNFYSSGEGEVIEFVEYSSDRTSRLDEKGVIELLERMGDIEI